MKWWIGSEMVINILRMKCEYILQKCDKWNIERTWFRLGRLIYVCLDRNGKENENVWMLVKEKRRCIIPTKEEERIGWENDWGMSKGKDPINGTFYLSKVVHFILIEI